MYDSMIRPNVHQILVVKAVADQISSLIWQFLSLEVRGMRSVQYCGLSFQSKLHLSEGFQLLGIRELSKFWNIVLQVKKQ